MADIKNLSHATNLLNELESINTELDFLNRQQTLRYPFSEISYREFDYNKFGLQVVQLLLDELTTKQIELQTEIENLTY